MFPVFDRSYRAERGALIAAQHQDASLQPLLEEVQNQPGKSGPTTSYFLRHGVLCVLWMPPIFPQEDASWAAVTQIIILSGYRQALLELAHDERFSWHLSTRKNIDQTSQEVLLAMHEA